MRTDNLTSLPVGETSPILPPTLLSLPPEILLSTINHLAPLDHIPSSTNNSWRQHTSHVHGISSKGKADLWSFAFTCRAMRELTMEGRFRRLSKPMGRDLENTWPKSMLYVAKYVQCLELHVVETKPGTPDVTDKDCIAILSALLPSFPNLRVLRVPTIAPLWSLQLKRNHLEFLDISVHANRQPQTLPILAGRNPPKTARPIRVDVLVITEKHTDGEPVDEDSDEGEPDNFMETGAEAVEIGACAGQCETMLKCITTVDEVILRLRQDVLQSPAGYILPSHHLAGFASKRVPKGLRNLTFEFKVKDDGVSRFLGIPRVYNALPVVMPSFSRSIQHLRVVWTLTMAQPTTGSAAIDAAQIDMHDRCLRELQRSKLMETVNTGGSESMAAALPQLKTFTIEFWPAHPALRSSGDIVEAYCVKPFLVKSVTVKK